MNRRNWLNIFKNKQITDFSAQSFMFALRIVSGVFVGAYVARYLGASQLGVMSLMIAVVGILAPFIDLGTRQLLEKKVAQEYEFIAEAFWGTLVVKFIVAMLVSAGLIGFCAVGGLTSLTGSGYTVVLIACLVMIVTPLTQFNALITAHLKNQKLLKGQIVILVAIAAYKIWLIQTGKPLNWFIMAYFIALLANILNVFWICWSFQIIPALTRIIPRHGFMLVRDGWMLMLSGLAVILYMKSDILMIDYYLASKDVGYYTVASNLIGMAYFAPVALANSFKKSVYQRLNENCDEEHLLQSLFNVFNAVGMIAAVAVIICAPFIVPLIYGGEYEISGSLLMVLALGIPAVALGVSRSLYLIHKGMNRFILLTSVAGLAVNISLNCLLIPWYGLMGAAVASVVAQYISALLSSLFIKDVSLFTLQLKSFSTNYGNRVQSFREINK